MVLLRLRRAAPEANPWLPRSGAGSRSSEEATGVSWRCVADAGSAFIGQQPIRPLPMLDVIPFRKSAAFSHRRPSTRQSSRLFRTFCFSRRPISKRPYRPTRDGTGFNERVSLDDPFRLLCISGIQHPQGSSIVRKRPGRPQLAVFEKGTEVNPVGGMGDFQAILVGSVLDGDGVFHATSLCFYCEVSGPETSGRDPIEHVRI